MRIDRPLATGVLLRRYKRFLADVELPSGEVVVAHCPNTGSLAGCLVERAPVVLRDCGGPARKLRYTLQSVQIAGHWVNVDTSLPNAVVAEAIAAGRIEGLSDFASLRREVKYGKASRIDLLLEAPRAPAGSARCFVEVKSTTLVVGGEARFPDAVTERGRKHLEELAAVVAAGDRGVILFHVSRGDATGFAPADEIDPVYGETLRRVARAGVEVMAFSTFVAPDELRLDRPLPIRL